MKKSLVIVESPSKAKTINKFLGADFNVKASVGHIKNLPEDSLGVNIEDGYIPQYVTIDRQKKVVSELKKEAANSDIIYLATDPDREGEAIAWHIANEIKSKNKNVKRALFNEITKNAVLESIKNPLEINDSMVDAQQARRVMDRLVGYKVSPILWKALYKGKLSAGRVQSVALKLICDREDEIRAFVQEEYWTIDVLLKTPDENILKARLAKLEGKKVEILNESEAGILIDGFKNKTFIITGIEKKSVRRYPFPPFITSTLQQDASIRLGFAPSKTMMVAQQLYEGVEIGKEGSVGLISYMRTDSMRVSTEALATIRGLIKNEYGEDYLPKSPNVFKSKKKGKVQDAHECIRPTYFDRSPDSIKKFLSPEQFRLYKLIWNRMISSQMTPAKYNQTIITINADEYEFRAAGRELLFPGFLAVYKDLEKTNGDQQKNGDDKNGELTKIPPGLHKEMILLLNKTEPDQHFTQPPPRFSDSSLVKELDQLGIGRPSTYALIIGTLKKRLYVILEKKRLSPTELGEVVNKIVSKQFPDIINVNFTAKMETELDQIESGKKQYKEVLDHFYIPFNKNLEKVLAEIKDIKKTIEEKAGITCDKCGREMLIKWGRYGKFVACSGFPECKNIIKNDNDGEKKAEPESAGFKCEKCGSDMVVRTGRYGKFYACSGYPKCRNIVQMEGDKKEKKAPEPAGFACDQCGKDMVIRKSKRGPFYACSGFPKCKYTKPFKK